MDPAILGIDLLWTAIAVLGIGVAGWALIDSYIDRRFLHQAPDFNARGPREVVVKMAVRSASASFDSFDQYIPHSNALGIIHIHGSIQGGVGL